jgi:hypothetical protein
MEEEFTVARLFVSKMKSEAKNLVSRAATLEQQQAEAVRRTEEMEKELSESRLTIVQVTISPFFLYRYPYRYYRYVLNRWWYLYRSGYFFSVY